MKMNEFTKEELDLLNKSMLVDMLHNPCTDSMDALREKILYMIETYDDPQYCEHSGIRLGKRDE